MYNNVLELCIDYIIKEVLLCLTQGFSTNTVNAQWGPLQPLNGCVHMKCIACVHL